MSSAKEALVRCPLRAVAPTEEAKSKPAICPQQRRLWCGAHSGRLPTQGGCPLRAVARLGRLPTQGGCLLKAVAYSRRLPPQRRQNQCPLCVLGKGGSGAVTNYKCYMGGQGALTRSQSLSLEGNGSSTSRHSIGSSLRIKDEQMLCTT